MIEVRDGMNKCDFCHTWRSKPCGEGCMWDAPPNILHEGHAIDKNAQLNTDLKSVVAQAMHCHDLLREALPYVEGTRGLRNPIRTSLAERIDREINRFTGRSTGHATFTNHKET